MLFMLYTLYSGNGAMNKGGKMVRFVVSNPSRELCCPTCNKPAASPYRVRFGLKSDNPILQGCVDDFHSGHLSGQDKEWHERPDSIRVRENMAKHRREVLGY